MLLLLGNSALGKSTGPLSEFPPPGNPRVHFTADTADVCSCLPGFCMQNKVLTWSLNQLSSTALPLLILSTKQHPASHELSVPCARAGEMKTDDPVVPSGNEYPGSSRKAGYGRLKSISSAEDP